MDTYLTLLSAASCCLVLTTCFVYERLLDAARQERDAALDHADEAQELVDSLLGLEREIAAHRHPSNVRVLRQVR